MWLELLHSPLFLAAVALFILIIVYCYFVEKREKGKVPVRNRFLLLGVLICFVGVIILFDSNFYLIGDWAIPHAIPGPIVLLVGVGMCAFSFPVKSKKEGVGPAISRIGTLNLDKVKKVKSENIRHKLSQKARAWLKSCEVSFEEAKDKFLSYSFVLLGASLFLGWFSMDMVGGALGATTSPTAIMYFFLFYSPLTYVWYIGCGYCCVLYLLARLSIKLKKS